MARIWHYGKPLSLLYITTSHISALRFPTPCVSAEIQTTPLQPGSPQPPFSRLNRIRIRQTTTAHRNKTLDPRQRRHRQWLRYACWLHRHPWLPGCDRLGPLSPRICKRPPRLTPRPWRPRPQRRPLRLYTGLHLRFPLRCLSNHPGTHLQWPHRLEGRARQHPQRPPATPNRLTAIQPANSELAITCNLNLTPRNRWGWEEPNRSHGPPEKAALLNKISSICATLSFASIRICLSHLVVRFDTSVTESRKPL